MSLFFDLYQTYEANQALVGKKVLASSGKEVVLLPLSHTYQNV